MKKQTHLVCSLLIKNIDSNGYIDNITWLRGKMKFISSVEQDISRVSEANEWDILLSTRNKCHISKHPCNILFISETFTKKV